MVYCMNKDPRFMDHNQAAPAGHQLQLVGEQGPGLHEVPVSAATCKCGGWIAPGYILPTLLALHDRHIRELTPS